MISQRSDLASAWHWVTERVTVAVAPAEALPFFFFLVPTVAAVSSWTPQPRSRFRPASFRASVTRLRFLRDDFGLVLVREGPPGVAVYTSTREITALEVAPDGSLLATEFLDSSIGIWNAKTGEPRARLIGHKGPVYDLVFSHDAKSLASASGDGMRSNVTPSNR